MASFPRRANRRILVLDDEADVLDFLRILLEALGWEVTPVSTPDAAFEALERSPHFLVLSDIAMPVMDGYGFMNEALERKVPSKLAFMTGFGYDPNHTLVRIRRNQHYPCLFKPFNREKVAQTVRQAYESYSAELAADETGESYRGEQA